MQSLPSMPFVWNLMIELILYVFPGAQKNVKAENK
ncbi:hypothetical protein Msip34_1155 [Methylovorus glucosotrophus SIP3-4]|uniref:Uncharacterized protein n=1 Tax=Methylovorus glucosotrophus (strain SIP3-4) TaxID=582744 RepID=C6XCX7_METGS|nr:hypothetical protein Msip34_1155 [Methylovorus glucosotrophus SIP3-4]